MSYIKCVFQSLRRTLTVLRLVAESDYVVCQWIYGTYITNAIYHQQSKDWNLPWDANPLRIPALMGIWFARKRWEKWVSTYTMYSITYTIYSMTFTGIISKLKPRVEGLNGIFYAEGSDCLHTLNTVSTSRTLRSKINIIKTSKTIKADTVASLLNT